MIMNHKPVSSALAAAVALALFHPGFASAETSATPSAAQEEAFLDILPRVEIPQDIQPIPGAVNEEFRNCQAVWPTGYAQAQSGPEARALRDIYSLVRASNVIATQDCSCRAKVASWEDVEAIATELRKQHQVDRLGWQQTQSISVEAKKLIAISETMCGGSF